MKGAAQLSSNSIPRVPIKRVVSLELDKRGQFVTNSLGGVTRSKAKLKSIAYCMHCIGGASAEKVHVATYTYDDDTTTLTDRA